MAAHFHQHHDSHVHPHVHYDTAFKIGMLLNIIYVAIEVGYGSYIHSVALVSDGIHNLTDVVGLGMSWAAFYLASRRPARNFTYGYGRATIIAAFLNALILLVAVGAIGWEAVQRINHPEPVPGGSVMLVAGLGIVINAATALLFFRDRHHDLNMAGNFLHMAADALVSLGVLLSGLVISLTGWTLIDPIISFVILIIIIYSTWDLMFKSLRQLLDSVPHHINIAEVQKAIKDYPGLVGYHDLHVWNLTTNQTALTVHLTIPEGKDTNRVLEGINHLLKEQFGITHSTIQIEQGDEDDECGQECLHGETM